MSNRGGNRFNNNERPKRMFGKQNNIRLGNVNKFSAFINFIKIIR